MFEVISMIELFYLNFLYDILPLKYNDKSYNINTLKVKSNIINSIALIIQVDKDAHFLE